MLRYFLIPALAAALMAQSPSTAPVSLKLGDPMPDFSLPNTAGEIVNTKLIRGPILVVFLSTQCPDVVAAEDRINALARTFIGMVPVLGINSNDTTGPGSKHENLESMKARAKEKNYAFHYLKDESQDVARAFGAVRTPDFFLFSRGKLVYHGRLDDTASKAEAVTKHELFEAMEAVEGGQAQKPDQVPAQGCAIKWRTQK